MLMRRKRVLGVLCFLAGSVALYAMSGQDRPAFSKRPAHDQSYGPQDRPAFSKRPAHDQSYGPAAAAGEEQPNLAAYKLNEAGGRAQMHPIPQLMAEGRRKWAAMQQRQSRELAAAVREYKRRYGLAPPDGFDVWFAYARQQGVVLVDEYDELMEALAPLRRLAAGEVRRRANALLRYGFDNQFGGLFVGQRGRKNVRPGEEQFGYVRGADKDKKQEDRQAQDKSKEQEEGQAQDKGKKQEEGQAQDKGKEQEEGQAQDKGKKQEEEQFKEKGKKQKEEQSKDKGKGMVKRTDQDAAKDKKQEEMQAKSTDKEAHKDTDKEKKQKEKNRRLEEEERREEEELEREWAKWVKVENEAGYRTAGLMRMLEPVKAVMAPTMARWPAFAVPVNEIAEERVVGGDDALWPAAAGLRGGPNTVYDESDIFHDHSITSRTLIGDLTKVCGPASNLAQLGGSTRFEVGIADAFDADNMPHGEGRLPTFITDPSADNDMCRRPELITASPVGSSDGWID